MLKKALILSLILFILILIPPKADAASIEANKNNGTLQEAFETTNLFNPALGKVVLIGLIAGTLGGLVSIGLERLNSSSEELTTLFWKERLGIGATTGVVVIWFIKPATSLALLTFSILSGSVGPSVFVALQKRVQATLELRRAQDMAEQERVKAEQETIKANASLVQETLNQIRERFRRMRDQDEAPNLQQWDELWESVRELETITPQQAENIANPLNQLQSQLNGKALQQQPRLMEQVDAAIDQARALIKMNQTNAPANAQSSSSGN